MLHGYGDGVKGAARLSGIPREYPKCHDNSGTPQNLSAGLGKPNAGQNTILNLGWPQGPISRWKTWPSELDHSKITPSK